MSRRGGLRGMALDPELLKRIQDAVEHAQPASPEDLLESLADEIVMGPDYIGYFNVKVTGSVDGMQTQPVTHLKFKPLLLDGVVVVQPAVKGEKGAIEFYRSETRRNGKVNLRAALAGFNLNFAETRSLRLPVKAEPITTRGVKRTVLLIEVQKPETKQRVERPRKAKKGEPGDAAPGGQEPGQEPAGEKTS